MEIIMEEVMSDFQKSILELVSKIPEGRVTTYRELARAIGRPNACRAVGSILARNPHPLNIPCHRVVRSDGKVGGYSSGGGLKGGLLVKEGVEISGGKVDLKKYSFKF